MNDQQGKLQALSLSRLCSMGPLLRYEMLYTLITSHTRVHLPYKQLARVDEQIMRGADRLDTHHRRHYSQHRVGDVDKAIPVWELHLGNGWRLMKVNGVLIMIDST